MSFDRKIKYLNKRIFVTIYILFGSFFFVFSQGNQWINYSQKYFKIKISKDGIYRISYSVLDSALQKTGDNITAIDPRNIQLFGRGTEQYIFIQGENDGSFDSSDFIEFYAEKNDGWFDSLLYVSPLAQTNPHFSLFTDTAYYFLTWNGSTANKRMVQQTNTNFTGFTPSDFCWKEVIASYNAVYFQGEIIGGINYNEYTSGKGWYDNFFDYPNGVQKNLNTPFAYKGPGAPSALFKVTVSGRSNTSENPDHRLLLKYGSSSSSAFVDTIFDGYKMLRLNFSVPASSINNSSAVLFEPAAVPGLPNQPITSKTAISNIYIKYAHTYDFENSSNFSFIIPPNPSATYISATNFSVSATANLYDLTGHNRITVVQSGATIKALVPSGGEKRCFITTNNNIANINFLEPVRTSGKFTDYSSVTTDSAFIIITNKGLRTEADKYASYRSGTGHNPIVADIDELYDQFAYGIVKHPLAIRNFCSYAINNWPSKPQYLFLFGKSLSDHYNRFNNSNYNNNLVPTFGWPSSDNLFTAGLDNTLLEPAIKTGRLSAKTLSEASAYRSKVMEYESAHAENLNSQTLDKKLWMKNILHFGGGTGSSEQNLFRNYLTTYQNIIEDTLYGGHVDTIFKTSSAPIQYNMAQFIKDRINSGVSIMTFFGHSTAGSFDVNVDHPSTYSNKGKYPLLIANSCFTGDIHNVLSESTSEEFILIANKGAIAYLASTSLGFAGNLHAYTTELYNNIGKTNYGNSIGTCIKNTVKNVQGPFPDILTHSTVTEMTLHGDPALVINTHSAPDYMATAPLVYFTPSEVTADADSFAINVIIHNLGKAITDSMSVEVKRYFPDGTVMDSVSIIPTVLYKDTFKLWMKVSSFSSSGVGLNQFEIRVDNGNKIPEISELNNDIIFPKVDLWIRSGDLIPIYPYDFAVVPKRNVSLKASTSDPFAVSKNYVLEADTTDTFDSPVKQQKKVTSSGGVITWDIDVGSFSTLDSTVIFWRASPDNVLPDTMRWREFSFQYIPDKRGWGQDHFFQFKKDGFSSINHNRTKREFEFVSAVKGLCAYNYGNPGTPSEYEGCQYRINGIKQESNICYGAPVMYVAVMDAITLEPWGTYNFPQNQPFSPPINPQNNFGNSNNKGGPTDCRGYSEKYFAFLLSSPAAMDSLREMLNNKIPDGNYVLVYTGVYGRFQDSTVWKTSHFQAMENLGATKIKTVPSNYPYIFFAKKGDISSAVEVVGTNPKDFITLCANMENNFPFGSINSTIIGPSYKWGSLHWKGDSKDNPVTDSLEIEITGISINNQTASLGKYLLLKNDILNLDSIAKASDYPYLQLKANMLDNANQTAVQLDRWHVLYEPAPEAALNPIKGLSFYSDSLQEGDSIRYAIAIENISEYPMDSMRIAYWIEDKDRNLFPVQYKKQDSLRVGQILYDTIKVSSYGFPGNNGLWVEANPKDSLWQLEQYHFNNIARIAFSVDADKINPLLDVTFDGIHILDGDIVSPKPFVLIQLKDENKYLALDDTADFKLYITTPNNTVTQLFFSNNNVNFAKAQLPQNRCKIEYTPAFTQDGKYKLRVKASDVSGNKSGDFDYTISFEVVNKSSITQVLNYPNPFSTSTRFVFTLTGSEIPDRFKIQIMTISGKVIREITEDELGPIRIGRNISQFAWDGTDQYGDPLANGVYLYRVTAKINGENIEHRSTEADTYFQHQFGKMYLMR